jgi:NAD+ synthase (glutamine-hydrolysing)
MKVLLAQQNYHIGNISYNTSKIIAAIEHAQSANASLVVFSELAVCGYPPKDLLEHDHFMESCKQALLEIAHHTKHIHVLVGAPHQQYNSANQKRLFNSAYHLHNGAIQQIIHKTLLPTYDIFDEARYFESATENQCITIEGVKFAITICEDIWNIQNHKYPTQPLDALVIEQPDCIINLSASPFDYSQEQKRYQTLLATVQHYHLPIMYCNAVGAQTDLVFDGGSLYMNAEGEIIEKANSFEEALLLIDTNISSKENQSSPSAAQLIASIHQALIIGIRDYFSKMGFQNALIASSGGIDSAVVVALACEALGPDKVHTLLLPSPFSSSHSISDAIALANNLNCSHDTIAIDSIYQSYTSSLAYAFKDLPFSVAEENLQSRIRGVLVMAYANKFNKIVLNTSNKSELATGYGTLYGDMIGGLSILGDLYKTQVYELAHYINTNATVIPISIIEKAPSAELRPNQKDSDSLPEYEILDAILFQLIEEQASVEQVIKNGFDEKLVKRTAQLLTQNEYKRNQFCPILRVSSKSFGSGRRIPIVAKLY